MIRCLDIHTHHPAPQPLGVINATMEDFNPEEGQRYSIGIHPWATTGAMPGLADWEKLEKLASLPCVVAIGECGVDKVRGGFMFKQMLVFNRQIELSEKLGKPLIVHDVKAHDAIVGLRRELSLTQKWVVHGFRGKPTVAKMLTDAGIYVSLGEQFNAASLPMIPRHLLLAETDESNLSIEQIIGNIAVAMGEDYESVAELIAANTRKFLYNESVE